MTTETATRDPGLTEQQRLAVETRQVSVSLSAGAGCGKTFVLTERFLDYFKPGDAESLEPGQLSHLVAITFTERAAREMRDRVRQKCYRRLASAKPAEADYWAELLRSLDNARISTIHSFCGWLLRSRAVEAGIDPQFEVLEQAQADTLLSEVIDDEARRLIAEGDEAAIELAVRFDLDALRQMLRRLVLDCRDEQFAEWLGRGSVEQVALWEAFHREKVLPAIARQIVASEPARQLLRVLGEQVPANAVMQARREVLLAQLALGPEAMALPGDVSAWLGVLRDNARVQGGGGASAWDSPETYAIVRDAAGGLRKLVDAMEPLVDFDSRSAAESAEVGRQLLAIAAGVARRYSERKQQIGALDFNDLLARARRLLVDPRHDALRQRLASQIRLLLVDEFQDTDPLQAEVIMLLTASDPSESDWRKVIPAVGKLFLVGDPKQSIYRFRRAEVSL
jgi:ATP-dependent helicase/nuclease subunit A